jgi:hypothetical protein
VPKGAKIVEILMGRDAVEGYSRQQFFRRGAIAAGGIAGLGLLDPVAAFGRSAGDPKPIDGGLKFLETDPFIEFVTSNPDVHVLPPAVGLELSSIKDFKGVVGASEIRGTARGSDGTAYSFDTDMRFMQGSYLDVDDRLRTGSFGFI